MAASVIIEVPDIKDIPASGKRSAVSPKAHAQNAPIGSKFTAPLVSTQYGVKPITASPPRAEKKQELPIPHVIEGMRVLHKLFGEGKVTWLDKAQRKIRVTFAKGEKTFAFPGAFADGILKTKE